MYRNNCKQTNPKLIIDATGSIVKKDIKYGTEKTKSIFLYEALAYDSHSGVTKTSIARGKKIQWALGPWFYKFVM